MGELYVYDGDRGGYGLSGCQLVAGREDPWYDNIAFSLVGPTTSTGAANDSGLADTYSRCIVKSKEPFTDETGHSSTLR